MEMMPKYQMSQLVSQELMPRELHNEQEDVLLQVRPHSLISAVLLVSFSATNTNKPGERSPPLEELPTGLRAPIPLSHGI